MFRHADFGAWLRALCVGLLAMGLALAFASPAHAQDQPQHFSMEVVGEGPDVILIPGLSTPRDVWTPTAMYLSGQYRLHLLQIRGFGDSAGANAEGPILQPLVDELAAYIAEQGLDHPAIVGHSLGGLAALMLGAQHPDLPGRLMIVDAMPWYGVLAAPGADVTMAMIEPQAQMLRTAAVAQYGQTPSAQMLEAQLRSQVLDQANLPLLVAWSGRIDMRVAGQMLYEDLSTDMRYDIAAITAPLMLLYPYNATYPTQEQAEPFYRAQYAALPSAQFTGIGPAGHFMMLDQPDQFHMALAAFLAN